MLVTNYFKATIIYLIGMFVLVMTTVLVKYAHLQANFSIYQIIFCKVTFPVLVLTPFYFKYFKTIQKQDIPLLLKLFIFTVPEAYMANLAWVKLPVNNAIIIMFMHPLIMTVLAWIILKEIIHKNTIVAIFIAIFGVLLAYCGGVKADGDYIWYLSLVGAMFSSGMAWIYLKQLMAKYPTSFVVYLRILCIMPFAFIFLDEVPELNSGNLKFIAFVTFSYIIERYLIAKAYSLTEVSKLQPWKFANIIYSSALGYLILGEKITQNQLYAIAIILVALFIGNKR